MDTKEFRELISLQLKMIKARLDKIKPHMRGRSVEMFITFQPLKNINPNDPEDPIPWRSNPDAQLTNYEKKLLAEQFQIAHKSMVKTPKPIQGSWSTEKPMYETLKETELYKSIEPWIFYCKQHMKIGTCTSRYKISGQLKPEVNRGAEGIIVDSRCVEMLNDQWKNIFKKVPKNNLMVIFNNDMYFLETKHLNRLKYNTQQTFF